MVSKDVWGQSRDTQRKDKVMDAYNAEVSITIDMDREVD